jgi:prophage regulatory protein
MQTETAGGVERIPRRNEMKAATGYCIARIYQLIAEDRFPKPIPLGDRAVGWRASEIADWQKARIAARDQMEAA